MDLTSYIEAIGAPTHALAMRELKPLSGLGPQSRAEFWPAWQLVPPDRRDEIVRAMVDLTEDNVDLDFAMVLTWCLEDPSVPVRVRAVDGLWEQESAAHCRRLLALLRDDPSAEVRAAATAGLARFAFMAELGEIDEDLGRQVLAALSGVLGDAQQPFDVRRRALESSGYFANDDGLQSYVQRAYESGEQLLKESALVAMGRSMLPRWLPVITRELGSPSPALRYEAARAAGELADEARALTPRLASLATDDDSEVASAAIWALGQIGGPAAKRALQQLSKSSEEIRSQAAADALAELNLEDGLPGQSYSRPAR